MAIEARRHSPRYTLSETAYVNFGSGTRGVILDVSEGGLRFKTAAPLDRTDPVRFWLTFSRRNEGEAHIAWTDESRTTGGLRFTAVPPEIRQQLREWMDHASSEPLAKQAEKKVNAQEIEEALALWKEPAAAAEPEAEYRPTGAEVPAFETRAAVAIAEEPYSSLRDDSNSEPFAPSPEPEYASVESAAQPASEPVSEPVSEPLLSRPSLIGKPSSLSMFPLDQPDAYTLARTQRSHRIAVAILVVLILIGAAAGAAAHYYPSQARNAMNLVQAKVEQFINPAHKQRISRVEPASMGGVLEATNPSDDTAEPSIPANSQPSAAASTAVPPANSKPSDQGSNNVGATSTDSAVPAPATADKNDRPANKSNAAIDLELAQKYLAEGSNPQQKTKAVQLLWMATEKGNVDAEIRLADMYAHGDNVPKSCTQARILLKAAATMNPALAQPKLSELNESGCN
jgi:TPR repeat protein